MTVTVQYRANRLPEAMQNAQLHGFDGAMFPWESAYSGVANELFWEIIGPFLSHFSALCS